VYRRSKFLEILIEIRQEMAREADFDTDLFAEQVRSGRRPKDGSRYRIVDGTADRNGHNGHRESVAPAKHK
jgi:hypothetical protein